MKPGKNPPVRKAKRKSLISLQEVIDFVGDKEVGAEIYRRIHTEAEPEALRDLGEVLERWGTAKQVPLVALSVRGPLSDQTLKEAGVRMNDAIAAGKWVVLVAHRGAGTP